MKHKHPTADGLRGSSVTTPLAAGLIQLLGSPQVYKSVAFSGDEWRAINRLYGFKPEPPTQVLMQAGADRNATRYAVEDGLRLLAWLAKHLDGGDDPLKKLVILASDAGWEVDPEDLAWAESEDIQEENTP